MSKSILEIREMVNSLKNNHEHYLSVTNELGRIEEQIRLYEEHMIIGTPDPEEELIKCGHYVVVKCCNQFEEKIRAGDIECSNSSARYLVIKTNRMYHYLNYCPSCGIKVITK